MKKVVYSFIAAMIIMNFGCSQSNKNSQSANSGNINSDSIGTDSIENDTAGHYIEIGTISDRDLWLRVNCSGISAQAQRLVDAYNAAVVSNSIITDFDLQMRGYMVDDVVEAIKSIEITKVKDQEVRGKLKAYKDEMLYLLSVDPDKVNQEVHNPWKAQDDLYTYLSKKFHVSTFGTLDEDKYWKEYNNCSSVPEWEQLRGKRGAPNMVKELLQKYKSAKDFDACCIYAIELGHAYEADMDAWKGDEYQNPAIPIMETLMKEKKYSLYLNELWQKWRVLYQDSKGASKDSEIPNWLYNDYRNMCCSTVLAYIEKHPQDIKAINEFLVMACKNNILREGEFDYGNQNAIEKYYLFPEKYAKDK